MDAEEVTVITRLFVLVGVIVACGTLGIGVQLLAQHLETMSVIERGGERREIDGKDYCVIPVKAEK